MPPVKQNNNGRKDSFFFRKMIDEGGKDWVERIHIETIRKKIEPLFRDIVRGNVPAKYHGYFYHHKLISAMIFEAEARQFNAYVAKTGTQLIVNQSIQGFDQNAEAIVNNPSFHYIARRNEEAFILYNILVNQFQEFNTKLQENYSLVQTHGPHMVKPLDIADWLNFIVAQCKPYRNVI